MMQIDEFHNLDSEKTYPLEDSFWIQATRADVSLDPSHVGRVLRCPVVEGWFETLDLGRRVLA